MTTVERVLRVYAVTSAFGGCFDDEFQDRKRSVLQKGSAGAVYRCRLRRHARRVGLAPDHVRGVLATLPADGVETVNTSPESDALRDAYLEAGVVGPASSNDAAHIAVATLSNADLVVSWNFKHIVHFEKIGGYEGVNRLHGHGSPRIYSSREVATP